MPDFARSLPFIPEDPRPADLSQYANADVKQGANEAIRLRFQLCDRVECWYGRGKYEGWSPGQIAKCWYREPDWPVGNFAPYQVTREAIAADADLEALRSRRTFAGVPPGG